MTFFDDLASAWPADFNAADLADELRHADRVIFIGNGGSAAIASHAANDFSKNGHIKTLAFNDGASLTCLANDLGYEEVFAHPLRQHARADDCVVAISSSGRSKNIIKAVQTVFGHGPRVVALSGFDDDNPLRNLAHVEYHVPSHDYGIVETIHLGMLHAALRELNAR